MNDWSALLAAVGSPAAAVLIRYMVRVCRRAAVWVSAKFDAIEKAVGKLAERMDALEPAVAKIKAELTPNGGSSVSDKVADIQTQILVVEARSRVTWSVSGEASYECDANGLNVWASPALCELFGMTPDEMSGSGWTRAIATAEERETAWQTWRHAVERNIPYEDVYRVKNQRTGEVRRVRTYTTVCRTPKNNAVARYFGVVVPVSGDGSPDEPPAKQPNRKPKG